MKKTLTILLFSIIGLFTYADEYKRNKAISEIVKFEIGNNPNIEILESSFKDSINIHPFDSVCIRHGIYAWEGMYDFIDKFAKFVALFPKGTKEFIPENMTSNNINVFNSSIRQMRKSLNHHRKLMNIVEEYKPYRTRRVYQDYAVKNGKGEVLRYRAFYFFNDKDELERYFWFDKFKLDGVFTMIKNAENHSFEIIEKLLAVAGFSLDPELMTYILSEKSIDYDQNEFTAYQKRLKKRIKIQHIKADKDRKNPFSKHLVSKDDSQDDKIQVDKYKINNNFCWAAYTDESLNKFTKYTIENNLTMIKYMLACGELILINKNEVVVMAKKGYLISKIILPNGSIVYTDTENLIKIN